MIIRNTTEDDYNIIKEWWDQTPYIKTPNINDLPDNGLSGLIIEEDGHGPVAAAFLYLTNSSYGYVDYMIVKPGLRKLLGDAAEDLVIMLVKSSIKKINDLGKPNVWAMASHPSILEGAKRYKQYFKIHDESKVITLNI
tara:strand:- start:172 stop:588 length:417 start_codon:yes stop_codon:yes gene_type:complete